MENTVITEVDIITLPKVCKKKKQYDNKYEIKKSTRGKNLI